MNIPLSIEDIKKQRKPVRNVNSIHKEKLSGMERFSIWTTEKIGTMGFFFIILLWTIFWIGWNVFMPAEFQFDPLPAFVLWIFISNMIQILLMPLILVGQNIQGKHSEARAEMDYDVNQRAEREVEAILVHLENQNEILSKIEEKLNRN